MPDDSKYTSLLAMVVVVAVPLIGVWEVFRQDETPSLRTFRLLLVLAFGLFLAVLALLREQLTKASLKSNVRKLETFNSDLAEMLRSILRHADPGTFQTADDSKYISLSVMLAVIAIPVIGVWEIFRQDETPSLRTFRLIVILTFGLFLAVLALLGEQLAKSGLKSDARKLDTLNSELVETVRAILRRADPVTFQTTFVNKQVENILGYPVKSWLQDPSFWVEHLHPEDRERTLVFTARAIQEHRNHELEYRMIAVDGRTVWLQEIVNVIVEKGMPSGLVGVSVDITARKLAEESMGLFRKLIDGSNDAIEILDPGNLQFLDINDKACLDLGYTRQEMLSMTAYDINIILDDSVRNHVDQRLREAGFVIIEAQHRRKDGSVFPVEMNIKYVHLGRGYIVAVVRDITQRKNMEESLSSFSRRLIQAHELERTRVARELHDDLTQRMALLQIGLGQLELEVSSVSSSAREQLRNITAVATKVHSGLDSISQQLHPSRLDILGLAPAVGALCRELSDQHHLQIQFVHHAIPQQLPKDVTLCLFRIAQEALQNVVKHSGAASATVELLGHDDRLDLSISDSGTGFSPSSAKLASGLGLVSMQERLRLVGGHLSVESDSSHGTQIHVRVPLHAFDPHVHPQVDDSTLS
jgi:PAS domain S-box-containing protein